jgi:hypothetical protein
MEPHSQQNHKRDFCCRLERREAVQNHVGHNLNGERSLSRDQLPRASNTLVVVALYRWVLYRGPHDWFLWMVSELLYIFSRSLVLLSAGALCKLLSLVCDRWTLGPAAPPSYWLVLGFCAPLALSTVAIQLL